PFGFGNLRKPKLDRFGFDSREVEPLAAGENGDRNLVRFGGREDELHVLGGLFQGLQQRVKRFLGEHVDFVDDVHLIRHAAGTNRDVLPQLPNLVDTTVARTVDLNHVDVVSGGYAQTNLALVTRLGRRPLDAVE